jgi:2-polyprenyl-6-methoxyphenol hydroxylase-like FAD-dependent oxidoreductase
VDSNHLPSGKVLISGGGIAGLTLGILLKEKGWEPIIVERDNAMRTEGYVIDFAGAGWDVAERMGIIDDIRIVTYQVDSWQYVASDGKPYISLSIADIRKTLDGKYTYLRRSDLERILFERAKAVDLTVTFGTTIKSLDDTGTEVIATLSNGSKDSFDLVFGADGVHSHVRELVFGPEPQFDRFLGYHVAAFHLTNHKYNIGTALNIYEEPDRAVWVYSLSEKILSAMYIFRHENIGHVPPKDRLPLVRKAYRGAGWIAERMLADFPDTEPIFFDSATQIVMPTWSKGRVALLGDAAACLTLLAGQGSHLAMAEAYVLATELGRHDDYRAAFAAYEKTLKNVTIKKQQEAVRFSKLFVPSPKSSLRLRRMIEKGIFNRFVFRYLVKLLAKSVLTGYR